MTNEMKLLRAFIEAQGYEINEILGLTLNGVPMKKPVIGAPFIEISKDDVRDIVHTIDYKVTKKEAKPLTFDKTGDVISIPPEAFAEAAKRDIARGIDTRSCDSNLQQLMRVFAEIKQ